MRFLGIALGFTLSTLIAAPLLAQASPAPAPENPAADVPPPPPPAPAPAPADASAPPASVPPAAAECVPGCRSGYLCQQGVCISACNPPCATGEQCTAAGECVASAPPPTFFQAPPPQPLPKPPDPGAERHDGFMLRFTIGFGGSDLQISGSGALNEFDLSGVSSSLSVDAGGSPIDNLVLHGRFAFLGLSNPKVSEDDDETDLGDHLSVDAFLLAPAVTYYFMPINIYVTGAVGLSFITFSDSNDTSDAAGTSGGLGLNLDVGKEWWVVDEWGFGVTGRFWYTRVGNSREEGLLVQPDVDYTLLGFTLLFSATYQ